MLDHRSHPVSKGTTEGPSGRHGQNIYWCSAAGSSPQKLLGMIGLDCWYAGCVPLEFCSLWFRLGFSWIFYDFLVPSPHRTPEGLVHERGKKGLWFLDSAALPKVKQHKTAMLQDFVFLPHRKAPSSGWWRHGMMRSLTLISAPWRWSRFFNDHAICFTQVVTTRKALDTSHKSFGKDSKLHGWRLGW